MLISPLTSSQRPKMREATYTMRSPSRSHKATTITSLLTLLHMSLRSNKSRTMRITSMTHLTPKRITRRILSFPTWRRWRSKMFRSSKMLRVTLMKTPSSDSLPSKIQLRSLAISSTLLLVWTQRAPSRSKEDIESSMHWESLSPKDGQVSIFLLFLRRLWLATTMTSLSRNAAPF